VTPQLTLRFNTRCKPLKHVSDEDILWIIAILKLAHPMMVRIKLGCFLLGVSKDSRILLNELRGINPTLLYMKR
jgi:hypothetical protein